eukprot:scaffold289290_cov25-Prasinocladus_malaysianus.AAC.3
MPSQSIKIQQACVALEASGDGRQHAMGSDTVRLLLIQLMVVRHVCYRLGVDWPARFFPLALHSLVWPNTARKKVPHD